MEKIKSDFLKRELGKYLLLALALLVCLGYLSWNSGTVKMLHVVVGVVAVISLGIARSLLAVRAACSELDDSGNFTLEREYLQEHPVYKVYQGEIHLLESYLVCRTRGKLLLIPTSHIQDAQELNLRSKGIKYAFVKIHMDNDKSYSIEAASETKEKILDWLARK